MGAGAFAVAASTRDAAAGPSASNSANTFAAVSMSTIRARASHSNVAFAAAPCSTLHRSTLFASARAAPATPPCFISTSNASAAPALRTAWQASFDAASIASWHRASAADTPRRRLAASLSVFFDAALASALASRSTATTRASDGRRVATALSASNAAVVTRRPPACVRPPTPQMLTSFVSHLEMASNELWSASVFSSDAAPSARRAVATSDDMSCGSPSLSRLFSMSTSKSTHSLGVV
mmetsp:Transcript_14517/g.52198  ORF Transcript_14517/g.52198 Transcript_14517/m.52198 type:complete len:239 (-) Transcript_14517:1745-2461(-)